MGTGEPNLTFLLRASHAGFVPDIVDQFPRLMRAALDERLHEGNASRQEVMLMLLGELTRTVEVGEDALGYAEACVTPAEDAKQYSMALAHKLKAIVQPAAQRAGMHLLTKKKVNNRTLADPEVARCLHEAFGPGRSFLKAVGFKEVAGVITMPEDGVLDTNRKLEPEAEEAVVALVERL